MGRRPAATGDSAPAGGWSSGMHPPFSFPSCGKENGLCTVQKKRPLRRAPARSCLRATRVGGWCGGRRGGHRIVSASLFAAAGLAVDGGFCNGPMRTSAPTGKTRDFTCSLGRTYVLAFVGMPKAVGSVVGADALVRPPAQAATTAQAARSDCAAVGGSAVLRMRRAPCGQAERAEGGASGTLVTEIRGAPQRETGKEERFKCARVLQSKTHYAAGIRR